MRPRRTAADDVVDQAAAYRAKPNLWTILLDTADASAPGGTGKRAAADVARSRRDADPGHPRRRPDAANVGQALLDVPGHRCGHGGRRGARVPARPGRPTKDPVRVALFAKRACGRALDHRPNTPFGPTPVHAGLLEVDANGRWGVERDFGGRFVPETLMAALVELERAYAAVRQDPAFWADLDHLLAQYVGRPTALYRADRLAVAVLEEAGRLQRPPVRAGEHGRSRRRPLASLPQARGPRPYRRPQDQQRAGPGLAHAPPGQVPRHRGDGRRTARRGDRDRMRPARAALRRVHG